MEESPAATTLPLAKTPESFNPQALVKLYCAGCHSNGRAGLDLDELTTSPTMRHEDGPTWQKMLAKLRAGEMPPRSRSQIPASEQQQFLRWIEQNLQELEPPQQGPFVVRRLQRVEYVNTVRDLLGVHFQPGEDFPQDQPEWVPAEKIPALPQGLLAKYRSAAASIVEEALAPPSVKVAMQGFDASLVVAPKKSASPGHSKKKSSIREDIVNFAHRAYRRPLSYREEESLHKIYLRARSGSSTKQGLKQVYREVLTSPHFLYRRVQITAMDPQRATVGQQYNLASRLSYLLWQTMPGKELTRQADKKTLAHNLAPQVERMLKDRKARVFADNFAAYWLGLDILPREFDDGPLEKAMRRETEEFVNHVVQEDLSILTFLDADYSFLNDILAQHYGVEGMEGPQFRRVKLPASQRSGLLTQARILLSTSLGPPDTSPVRRGKWILDNILGTPPQAPPSGLVRALDNAHKDFPGGSFRQRFERHRSDPSCASCHLKVDPLGFALENLDYRGAWRTREQRAPVDASAVLPTGEAFEGVLGLRDYLKSKKDLFIRCLAGKLMMYAKGRQLRTRDWEALDTICKNLAGRDPRFSEVLVEVIKADVFPPRSLAPK
jgi:hypothetical protein